MNKDTTLKEKKAGVSRRKALKAFGLGATVAAGAAVASATPGKPSKVDISFDDQMGNYFQDHYKKMTKEEIKEALARLERRYKATYDVDIKVDNMPAQPGVLFGYALNISKCKGYRECVKACTETNNQSRDPEIQFIRVLEMDKGSMNMEEANHYFSDDETVPKPDKWYLPIQCHQCENPPCVKACPVEATWKEPDGITVIDYNWCIGCRMCMNACPYWARRFNWKAPSLPKEDINPVTHYLANRPREKGVVEKCFFCLQKTRKGEMPACQEACPTGARVFGNLLDPNSEIRYVLEHKNIFRLKEDLQTEPKFWYYSD
ncbi:MAG: 4Fe-4S ferredoxin [SAR324 cluster bacterium]|uniref:4Fe-4S ferredoxin n=1 Tax=SAR324 cluster bacterium TaxID=2024889 RepID=A0A2A4T3E6_9DELT|nr:MAG: 4Fe-4S ferredoxin [SAR324 cluster bacterium]